MTFFDFGLGFLLASLFISFGFFEKFVDNLPPLFKPVTAAILLTLSAMFQVLSVLTGM